MVTCVRAGLCVCVCLCARVCVCASAGSLLCVLCRRARKKAGGQRPALIHDAFACVKDPAVWPWVVGWASRAGRGGKAHVKRLRAASLFLHLDSFRGSSVKIGTIPGRLAWPLRKDDTHKSRSDTSCFCRLHFAPGQCEPFTCMQTNIHS